jgi:hypothetical protein
MFLGSMLDRQRRAPALSDALLLAVGLAWLVLAATTAQACENSCGTETRATRGADDIECGASPCADEPRSDGCCPTDGGECTAACCAAGAAMTSASVPALSFTPIAPVAPSSPTAPLFPESPPLDRPPRF